MRQFSFRPGDVASPSWPGLTRPSTHHRWRADGRFKPGHEPARPLGRNQTSLTNLALAPTVHRGMKPTVRDRAALANKKASSSTRSSRETAGRSRRRTVWRSARSARFLLLRVLARPPCFSVLKNLLAYLGPAAGTRNGWASAGQREDGCISRRDVRQAGPARGSRKSMCCRRFRGKSSQPAGIFKVSSMERFSESAKRRLAGQHVTMNMTQRA